MSDKKTKSINFVSPRGTAKYPKIDQPYSWSNAQNRSVPDSEGQYELNIVMPEKDATPIKEAVKEAIKLAGIKPTNLPFKKEIDKDTGAETGNVEVKFRAYGKRKDGSVNKIKVVDAKLHPMPSNFRLTSGSIVKVDSYITVAKLGARLNIRAVQVLDLAPEMGGNNFSAEEGFEYEEDDATETTVGTTNEETNSDDLDF